MKQQRSRQGAEKQYVRDKRKSINSKVEIASDEIQQAGADSPYRSIEGVASNLVAPSPPDEKARPSGRKRKTNAQIFREIEQHTEFRDIRERPPNLVQGFTKVDRTIVQRIITKEPYVKDGISTSSSSSSSSAPKKPTRPVIEN